jgi:NADH-quinone oxidoreductase subunit N
MTPSSLLSFLPELVLLLGALVLFIITLGHSRVKAARIAAMATGVGTIIACVLSIGCQTTLFDQAYRIDPFSQTLKMMLAIGFVLVLLLSGNLSDVRDDIKPEYFLFVILHFCGLTMLMSSIDMVTLVIALELSSFPLYLLVPMRRERQGQRSQMESAMKYIMFGTAANGIMFFGMSYLYGLTGTTSLPRMLPLLLPLIHSPIAIAGLALTFCGLFYKLAIFPFHFWTPDVYQGASNETTSLIASLPKIGAVAVLVRFVTLAPPNAAILASLMTFLAIGSMCYGNLVALVQTDLKRLLGFSGIAHAGYALMGFVAMDTAGYTAALFYIAGYALMVLACFVVVCKVSTDGANLSMAELAGLHRRSPLLAATLVVGVFALAGIPPFAGFMGKLSLLSAALAKGHLTIVIVAVLNSAVAIYYYLCIVRETCCRGEVNPPPIHLDLATKFLCVALIAGIVIMGIAPAKIMDVLSQSLAYVNLPLTAATVY